MPIGNAGFHMQICVSDFILNLSLIYKFREFNLVAIWNKGKTLIFVSSTFQIWQLEILVSLYINMRFRVRSEIQFHILVLWICILSFLSHWILPISWYVHSKTQCLMKSQFLACRMWLLKSFISKVSGYHHLTLPKLRSY